MTSEPYPPHNIPADEWAVRVDLAAAYRLVALWGWDDLIFTHLSAKIPGPDHHFLINPYNRMFEEITASSLVKIDPHGAPVDTSNVRRSEERRVGKECSAVCRSRWSPYH